MKVKPSVKPICEKCKVIKRKGRVMVICQNPKRRWLPPPCETLQGDINQEVLIWHVLPELTCPKKSELKLA